MVEWFCSERMYWLPWPEHVQGWWQWSQSCKNVLFVQYEEMSKNFVVVLDRVAGFLGYQLTAEGIERITEKCSFQYMKDNEELFEMAPPNMFSVISGQFFASGKESRHEDVTPSIRQRILDYCRESLRGNDYPALQFYPDLAVPAAIGIESVQGTALELSRT
jgi:hypothetical protein